VTPLLMPLSSAGLVAVLVAFLLLQRHGVRDRLVRLIGGDVHVLLQAFDDAGQRVSAYLVAQVLVNVGYGIPMALGLWWIGVPGAWLWGVMAAVLRFIPYLGPALGALFPLTLAFAVDPGWSMVVSTALLVLALELVSNNVVEPIAYGARTGVSSIAIILSAAFWALIWGLVGLILATPMTVCLVVLSRYLGPLRMIDTLLGSEPVFEPPVRLYQRLLSGHDQEVLEMVRDQVHATSLQQTCSDMVVPMLTRAASEAGPNVTVLQRYRVVTGAVRLIESLRGRQAGPVRAPGAAPGLVLCVGARTEFDTLSAELLVQVLHEAGVAARAVAAVEVTADRVACLDLQGVSQLVLCTHSSAPQTQLRFVCRRLRRRCPRLHIMAAAWAAPAGLLQPDAARLIGVDVVAASLGEAVGRLVAAAPATATPQWPGDEVRHGRAVADAADADGDPLARQMARVAQQAVDVFGVALATVTWRDRSHGWREESAGRSTWTLDRGRGTLDPGSPLAQVALQGEPLMVPDIAREPRFAGRQSPRLDGLISFAGTPIHDRQGATLGVLALHDGNARTFSDEEIALLDDMTEVAARCLERQSPGGVGSAARR
jgi:GAF domain-containing protein